ncbi:MAG: carboxypeptidase regulatory-like domain-containing protein [Bryobacteraceae bacterium]
MREAGDISGRLAFTLALAGILAVCLTLNLARAQQSGTAGIYGSVADSQGGVIPGARVTLTHVERNQDRQAVTNEAGQYAFPLIPIGNYRLRVENSGFKVFEQTGIQLQVNDNVKIDVTLEVGDVNTRVQVEAMGSMVETSSSTIRRVVDGKRVLELPLNGRNVLQLGLLVPGVIGAGGGLTGNAKAPANSQLFSVNGSRQNSTKFTLDGGDNQDNLTNVNSPYPFPDAVEEFSVQTSNMGAEVGKSSAGAVNVVTKSGTNEFHGSGFWFVRNYKLNAGSYFLHQSDNLKRNQLGGTFGGPVKKDKLFFFGGVQRTWIRTVPTESRALTMIPAHRSGDFSDVLRLSRPITILDPTTGRPFAGNQIPQSRFSPAAQNLLKDSPLPGPDGFTRWSAAVQEDPREYVVRVDWRPNVKHNLLGRYLQNSDPSVYNFVPGNLHSVTNTQSSFSKNATLGYTLVVSPAVIADSHFTVARTYGNRWNYWPKTIADYGVKVKPSSNQIGVSINGTSGLSLSTVNPPAIFARTNFDITHSWRWIKGRHNLVGGLDLMFSRYNENNSYLGSGSYSFNGRYTGYDQADYILGLMSSFSQSNGEIEARRYHYQAVYVNDAFRITRRLTLNFGLRWEPFTPMTDLKDRQVQFRAGEYAKRTRSKRYTNAPPGLYYPGDTLSTGYVVPKAGVEVGRKQFAPRVGLAWDVKGDGRTSVRLGYGIFYDVPMMYALNNMNVQTPFSFTTAFTEGLFDDPYRGRENLNLFPFAGDFDKNTPFQLPTSAVVYPASFKLTYTQNWNVTLERSIASWVFQVSYVGSKGTHLNGDMQLNPPTYNYNLTLAQNRSTVNQRRPMQEFSGVSGIFYDLNSIYNGLQASANKRFSKGFSIQTSYTWAKAIDYRSSNNEASTGSIWNPYNWRMQRGLSDYDRAHRFIGSFVWNLPKPGKRLNSRPLGVIVDDWQFSGIYSATTGGPLSFTSTNDAMASAGTPLAVITGNLFLPANRSRGERIAQYFNTSAVAQAAEGTWGSAGRGILRGPGGSGTDVSLTRTFPLKFRETANLVFRSEFFSLFNHPQIGGPETRLGRSTFGQITGVGGTRVLQLSLKIGF